MRNGLSQSTYDQIITYFLGQSSVYIDSMNLSEWHIYGSSRIGIYQTSINMAYRNVRIVNSVTTQETNTTVTLPSYTLFAVERGSKRYELTNHLGNVLAVVSDKKIQVCTSTTINYYIADLVSATDYSPFGAPLAGRTYTAPNISYRFAFNGQEKDDEVSGEGNTMTAEFWEYDARLGRRFNRDPKPNPAISDYACFANNPIMYSDPKGDTLFVRDGPVPNQALNDIKGMVAPENRGYISIQSIADRNGTGFNKYVQVNAPNYVPGTDAGMDLLLNLSGENSMDAIYTTETRPQVQPASGNPRKTFKSTNTVGTGYFGGILINVNTPKGGIGTEDTRELSGDFPPTKPTLLGNSMIGAGIAFQLGLDPNVKNFSGTVTSTATVPRSMVAFQQLQACYLFVSNTTTTAKYSLSVATQAANINFTNGSYRGDKNKQIPDSVPNLTKRQ